MSIIRENQIRQIREEDNRLRKIVLNREKQGIKNYDENIKPVEILDTTIVDENKGSVQKFLNFLNELYLRLYIIANESKQFKETFSNTKGSEYRKYIELLNIVKPFNMWENLMTTYTNPALNETTREGIKKDLQKVTPFVININEYLDETIKDLCNIWMSKSGLISDDQLFDKVFEMHDQEYYSMGEAEKEKYRRTNIEDLKEIDVDLLLKEHIESNAFYEIVLSQIESDRLEPITKEQVVLQIGRILNDIYAENRSVTLYKNLVSYFSDTELPELAPKPSTTYDVTFKKKYDELESMTGNIEREQQIGAYNTSEMKKYYEELDKQERQQKKYNKALKKYRLKQRIKAEEQAGEGEEKEEIEPEGEEDEEEVEMPPPPLFGQFVGQMGPYQGEGKPKKGRRKYIKKNTMKRQTRPALGFNDEGNEMFYSSESN
jgi:hypothetical protein